MTKDIRGQSMLFFGLNTLDLQFVVSEYPQPNTKTKAIRNEIFAGGPATNAAITCAHLGADVALMTPIGIHPLKDYIFQDIHRHNVRIIDPIERSPGEPIFASIITDEKRGERTIFSYHPQTRVSADDIEDLDLRPFGYALFDGFYPEAALPLARRCRENGIVTILDGGSMKPGIDALLGHIDVAICSNDFRAPSGERHPSSVFAYLRARGVSKSAITRGEKQILFSEGDGVDEIEVASVPVIDTLGAGDIFHGAFVYYFAGGLSFEGALRKASRIASASCASLGTREWMKRAIHVY